MVNGVEVSQYCASVLSEITVETVPTHRDYNTNTGQASNQWCKTPVVRVDATPTTFMHSWLGIRAFVYSSSGQRII